MPEFPILQVRDLQVEIRERGTILMMVSNRVMWAVLAVAAGAGLAAVLMPPARSRWLAQNNDQSNRVDEASVDSFPASDPPSFSADTGAQAAPGPVS
jgi:hypothetical protein